MRRENPQSRKPAKLVSASRIVLRLNLIDFRVLRTNDLYLRRNFTNSTCKHDRREAVRSSGHDFIEHSQARLWRDACSRSFWPKSRGYYSLACAGWFKYDAANVAQMHVLYFYENASAYGCINPEYIAPPLGLFKYRPVSTAGSWHINATLFWK